MLASKPPILVEVRFPNMGTSPGWFLCEDEDGLGAILERVGPGAEVYLNSVWDLRSAVGGVVLKK